MRKRQISTIFAIVLVDMIGFSLVLPLLAFYGEKYGANPVTIGLLGGSYAVAQLFAAPVLGRLSDRFGRRPILLVSILGSALGFLLLGAANTLALVFVARIVDGITGGNISVAQAYIADVTTPEDRGRALGMIGAAFGIGFIIGPVIGGLLASNAVHSALLGMGFDVSNLAVPAYAAAFLCFVNLGLTFFLLPESLAPELRDDVSHKAGAGFSPGEFAAALRRPVVGPILVIRVVTGFTFAMFESGFIIWAPAALHVSPEQNAFILAYVGVLLVLVQLFAIGRLTRRFADTRLILWGIAIVGLTFVGWGFTMSVIPLLLLLIPMSAAMATSNTVMTSSLSKAVTVEEVGGVLGISAGVLAITRALGAPAVGALIQFGGLWAPGVVAGVLTLSVVPYIWWAFHRPGIPETVAESGEKLTAESPRRGEALTTSGAAPAQ